MMVIDQSGIRKRFAPAALALSFQPATRQLPKGHPGAFKAAFDAALDERRFLSDLEYVLVSIAAIMCCTPASTAQSDERVKRMLLALEGFSTPYLQTRFKQEAYQVANRKSAPMELSIRARKPRSRFPLPATAVREHLREHRNEIRSTFFVQQELEEQLTLKKKYCARKISERRFFENQRHEKMKLERKHRQEEIAFFAVLAAQVPAPAIKLPAPRPGM